MKSQQPVVPGGNPVCPVQMIEHTTYRPYTQVELVDLTNLFCRRPGKPLAVWLLHLWDLGVDSIMCSDSEMEKLASIMTHPSLHQRLQNSLKHSEGQGSHSLMEWVMAAISTVLANVGDLPDMVSKCQSFTDLVQILKKLGVCQAMLNPNT